MIYFAYGSNLSADVIASLPGFHQTIGLARLDNFRLAFTRWSPKWKAGVADIVESPGMCLWGILYNIDEDALLALDAKEGLGSAYMRIEVNVTLPDESIMPASSYTVISKSIVEITPSKEYLNSMIQSLESLKVDSFYVAFLESLMSEAQDSFRHGFLVRPTLSRAEALGYPIVRVSTSLANTYRANRFCVISYRGKTGLAVIAHGLSIPSGICEIDQSMRSSLSIKGRFAYGSAVMLHPLNYRPKLSVIVNPRSLVLPLQRASVLDSEKQICTLHQKNIVLLGLSEGDYVRITGVVQLSPGIYKVSHLSRRVYSGSASVVKRSGIYAEEYPKPGKFYLDLDGRLSLGFAVQDELSPVLIAADTSKLFLGSILRYGLTLLAGLLALHPLVEAVYTHFHCNSLLAVITTISIAAMLAVVATVIDLRSRVGY